MKNKAINKTLKIQIEQFVLNFYNQMVTFIVISEACLKFVQGQKFHALLNTFMLHWFVLDGIGQFVTYRSVAIRTNDFSLYTLLYQVDSIEQARVMPFFLSLLFNYTTSQYRSIAESGHKNNVWPTFLALHVVRGD